ncbi:cysteine-rich RLK (RECEPTOR-like protein kinase) 8 [Abeliophyllum distichum]|uniref:Cysteine-rich RLK (RECEPTOR-like protein kinase) 8 n=1 Tax=Abeliophyllum distichum TaxID=126358 RepID=A0ABD1U1W1_9LAMI
MPCLKERSFSIPEKDSFVKEIDLNSQNNDETIQDAHTEVETVQPDLNQAEVDINENQNQENSNDLSDYQLVRDRERRIRHPSSRVNNEDFVTFFTALDLICSEPNSYEEAVTGKNSKFWLDTMQEEMNSLLKKKTWTLVNKPKDQKVIDCKWVYKIKEGEYALDKVRYKARLVAKVFTQREWIDFNEIFSPVAKYTSIRILLALTAQFDWELDQLDVKTAFLNGDLDEVIYMSQPKGDLDKRRSTSSYVFTLCDGCISWKSQLQKIVAISSTEAEYIAACDAVKEGLWLRGLLGEIGFRNETIRLYTDNQSAIHLSKNPVYHDKTKHVDIKFHFVRDMVEKNTVDLIKIPTQFNPSDIGTFEQMKPKLDKVSCTKEFLTNGSSNSSARWSLLSNCLRLGLSSNVDWTLIAAQYLSEFGLRTIWASLFQMITSGVISTVGSRVEGCLFYIPSPHFSVT